MYSSVKHTLTNGGECKRWSPMILKCTPTLGVAVSLECLEPWLKRQTCVKLGPQDTIGKVFKFRCLKCSRIAHLDLICMSYDQKKGWKSNWEFDSRPQIPLEQGSNDL
jgi:hypothetical protein